MPKGLKVLRAVSVVLSLVLIVGTVVSFFLAPSFQDAIMRKKLGDPDAIVTDTARSPWIYVNENGVARIESDVCYGMDEIVIPDAVNGIAVVSFDMEYKKAPAWVKRVVFPKTLRSVCDFPFYTWSGIEEIVFSEGIEDLSNMHISEKAQLKKLVLPRSLRKIKATTLPRAHEDFTIYYAGTKEEWLAVEGGAYLLTQYPVVFESNGVE